MSNPNPAFEAAMQTGHWRDAYPMVEDRARYHLEKMAPGAERISTAQLAESIYPTKGAFVCDVRKRVFKALEACASRGLAPYVELGPLEQIGLTNGRRKLWGPARAPSKEDYIKLCPHCGGRL